MSIRGDPKASSTQARAGPNTPEAGGQVEVTHDDISAMSTTSSSRQATTGTGRARHPLDRLTRPSRVGAESAPAAWGGLRFASRPEHSVPTKWAAVGVDAPAADVIALLTDTWSLPHPSVIFSVTGAAAGAIPELSTWAREAFQIGFLDALRRTKAWITSGGTDGGVMRLVGETMARQTADEPRAVCLGVATWGIVKNHERLEKSVAHVSKYDPGFRRANEMGPRAPLEPNHTHFLFVDAGPAAEGQFGKEIKLRAAVEDAFCRGATVTDAEGSLKKGSFKGTAESATTSVPTPVMLTLVVGGGA